MKDLKTLLDKKFKLYSQPAFIATDPIQIPHQFSKKQDIEIAGLLSATIAWGNRKSIINNANRIMKIMDNSPHDFILNATNHDFKKVKGFVHRTFNESDLLYFFKALKNLYKSSESLENYFLIKKNEENTFFAIERFRDAFLFEPEFRTKKHISSPANKSAAKRLNMFLRWMVRKGEVDFGIWANISPAKLAIPLDVHTGRVARELGLLERKANDWTSVEILTNKLKEFDPNDPIKYDFSLFGMGAFE